MLTPLITSERKSAITLALIFICSIGSMVAVYRSFPRLEESERAKVTLPKNFDDARALGSVLARYTQNHYWPVLSGLALTYIL